MDKREGENGWRTENEFCFFLTFFTLVINAVETNKFKVQREQVTGAGSIGLD